VTKKGVVLDRKGGGTEVEVEMVDVICGRGCAIGNDEMGTVLITVVKKGSLSWVFFYAAIGERALRGGFGANGLTKKE